MKIFSILLTLLSATVFLETVSTQIPLSSSQSGYKFNGTLKTPSGEILAGTNLNFKSGEWKRTVASDVEGKFSIDLQPGKYEIATDEYFYKPFQAFINIEDGGINPSDVEFIIEPNDPCGGDADNRCPKLINEVKPPYPPAARAVRAWGEVVVGVKVNAEGKVILAKAESGHPLLRAASESAAKASKFESSTEGSERDVKLVYVFLLEKKKDGLKYYINPNSIEKVNDITITAITVG